MRETLDRVEAEDLASRHAAVDPDLAPDEIEQHEDRDHAHHEPDRELVQDIALERRPGLVLGLDEEARARIGDGRPPGNIVAGPERLEQRVLVDRFLGRVDLRHRPRQPEDEDKTQRDEKARDELCHCPSPQIATVSP